MTNPVAWVLVFHMVGMVFWIGGLFLALAAIGMGTAVPAAADDSIARQQRARLAQKAMRNYAHIGAALMVITGALLIYLIPGIITQAWLHAKLTLVVILIVFDLLLTMKVRRMPAQEPSPSQMGMFHGVISLLFLLILVLVWVKPF